MSDRKICLWQIRGSDQGNLQLSRLRRRERRGGRNGAGLPRRVDVEVQSIPNGGLHKGEYAFVF